MTRPRVARRSRRCSSVPEIPATDSDVTNAAPLEGGRERPCGCGRRAVRSLEARALDRQRRERARLAADVRRLPARRVTARVEVALVGHDAPGDTLDPPVGNVPRELTQIGL